MQASIRSDSFDNSNLIQSTVMAIRTICRGELLVKSYRLTSVISDVSPIKKLNHSFGTLTSIELCRHLRSYTDKLFVCEADGGIYIIISSLYPASGFVPAFFFEDSGAVLRLLRECDSGQYTISAHTKQKNAKISAIDREFSEPFFDFFKLTCNIFSCVNLDINTLGSEARREYVLKQCSYLSYFTSCPIELAFSESLENESEFPKLDFQLFTAFLLTLLYSVKHRAESRTAYIMLDVLSHSLLIEAHFSLYQKALRYSEFSEWEHMAYNKNMLFELSCTDNILKIRFNPFRADWSLLGIKQKTK